MGPPLGAYFTSHVNLFDLVPFLESIPYSNPYSSPALFALVLIVVETIYLYIALPETLYFHASRTHGAGGINSAVSSPGTANDTPDLPYSPPSQQQQQQIGGKKSPTGTALLEKSLSNEVQSSSSTTTFKYSSKPSSTSSSQFNILSILHFMFLFCFSGMEFTLPFLTHDIFDFSPMQQGKLLAFIGVASALVQGGYVRRVAHKTVHEKTLLLQGVASCSIGLVAISLVRPLNDFGDGMGIYALYFGSAFLAFTSGTVVSSLTALASFTTTKAINNNPNTSNLTHPSSSSDSFSDTPTTRTTSSSSNSTATPLAGIEAVGEMTQGHALGKFRSLGQLGRAVGPIAACSAYWVLGSMACYQVGAVLMAVTFVAMWVLISVPKNWKRKVKNQ